MLQRTGWEKTSRHDMVTRFEYSSKKNPIAARPTKTEGHGWIATVSEISEVSHS